MTRLATQNWIKAKMNVEKMIRDFEARHGITLTVEAAQDMYDIISATNRLETWTYAQNMNITDEEAECFEVEEEGPTEEVWGILAQAIEEKESGVFVLS